MNIMTSARVTFLVGHRITTVFAGGMIALGVALVAEMSFQPSASAANPPAVTGSIALPDMLDLSPFYCERFVTTTRTNRDFASLVGIRPYDGLPFLIEGRGFVYGRKQSRAGSQRAKAATDFVGIPVGRVFDELHLLHGTRWPDVDGETIAFIRLNYADGSTEDLPIRYGVHVRDWLRLRSEEDETLSDPNSKVVFRAPPGSSQFKSTARLVKTMLPNPQPEKVVATVDVISTRHYAAYELVAATVAQHDSTRRSTLPVPDPEPPRRFDGMITIRVLDHETGAPIPGALIEPSLNVDNTYVIARPLYSSEDGTAVIRYPLGRVDRVYVFVEKEGYKPKSSNWTENIPSDANFQLQPSPASTGELAPRR